jgi:hypothetical protein
MSQALLCRWEEGNGPESGLGARTENGAVSGLGARTARCARRAHFLGVVSCQDFNAQNIKCYIWTEIDHFSGNCLEVTCQAQLNLRQYAKAAPLSDLQLQTGFEYSACSPSQTAPLAKLQPKTG